MGNTNRFETLEECQSKCVVDESLRKWIATFFYCHSFDFIDFFLKNFLYLFIAACEQPLEEGPCNGNYERWYFDKEEDTCKPFRYGGCKGTKNNFASEAACKYQCKNPSVQKGKLNSVVPTNIYPFNNVLGYEVYSKIIMITHRLFILNIYGCGSDLDCFFYILLHALIFSKRSIFFSFFFSMFSINPFEILVTY